jgi:hypothetical protein
LFLPGDAADKGGRGQRRHFINVTPTISSGTNPQILANGTSGEINWLAIFYKQSYQDLPALYVYLSHTFSGDRAKSESGTESGLELEDCFF